MNTATNCVECGRKLGGMDGVHRADVDWIIALRKAGIDVPDGLCADCFLRYKEKGNGISTPLDDTIMKVNSNKNISIPLPNWSLFGWSIVGLGIFLLLISLGNLNAYSTPNEIILAYAGGALIPSGLLVACIGSVIDAINRMSIKLDALSHDKKL